LIESLNKSLIKLESWAAAISLLLILVLSLLQIIVRNFFDFGFPEIEVINRNLLVICGMMGATLATSHLQHIKVDALTAFMSKKVIAYLHRPICIFCASVCAALCYYSIIFFTDEWAYAPVNERWTLPFKLIYPIGFLLLSLHFLLSCRKKLL